MVDEPESIRFSAPWMAALMSFVFAGVVSFPLICFALVMPRLWGFVWAALVLLGTAAVVVRTRRLALVVTREGVAIHNLWRSYWLPWESVEAVELTDRSMLGEGPGDKTIDFVLRGGRRVQSQASFGRRGRRARMLDAIRKHANGWDIPVA